MAMARPIILGVEGESREIVETGRCGLCIEPENADALVEAIGRLSGDEELAGRLGENGRKFVTCHYDREALAARYLSLLCSVAGAVDGALPTEGKTGSAPSGRPRQMSTRQGSFG
jgi:glycosyltransferase involved in cell wall biosynthesis